MIIKHLPEIPTGSPPAGVRNTDGINRFHDFRRLSRYISQTIQDSAIISMKR